MPSKFQVNRMTVTRMSLYETMIMLFVATMPSHLNISLLYTLLLQGLSVVETK